MLTSIRRVWVPRWRRPSYNLLRSKRDAMMSTWHTEVRWTCSWINSDIMPCQPLQTSNIATRVRRSRSQKRSASLTGEKGSVRSVRRRPGILMIWTKICLQTSTGMLGSDSMSCLEMLRTDRHEQESGDQPVFGELLEVGTSRCTYRKRGEAGSYSGMSLDRR